MNIQSAMLATAVIFISSLMVRADDTPDPEAQPVSEPAQPVAVVSENTEFCANDECTEDCYVEDVSLQGTKPAVRHRIRMESKLNCSCKHVSEDAE